MNPLISTEYERLWSDPALQTRIDEGIRTNRQSDAVIRVTDYADKPRPGVKVFVDQHDASFHFGANIFKLGDYPSEELNRRYEDAFCSLFNGVTVPFYWRTLEPEQGRPRFGIHSVPIARRPPPDRVVSFCQERGLRMHGHTLLWNFRKWSVPDWLPEDPDEVRRLGEKRFREIGERYGHAIKNWDVVNEAAGFIDKPVEKGSAHHAMFENYEHKAFEWAERFLPDDCRFDINETTGAWNLEGNGDRLTRLIKKLTTQNARIGGIGLQFHLFSDEELHRALRGDLFPPDELLKALDHYEQFGKPIHVSEITLTSPGNTLEGLEAQAEVARNFYRLWFSHPSVTGITWWNLPDGGAAPGEDKVYSGLLFEDMRPKPAYIALQNLIHREWRTQAEGVTGDDGCFRFRGFHGSHVIRTGTGLQSAITLEPGKVAEQLLRL